jgi:hypothetical protein
MSQSGSYNTSGGGGGAPITTLTGNTGGAVSPSAGNINVVGTGSISVTGNPGTHTLTISSSGGGGGITTLDGDSGSATGTTVTIAGGSNINTSATSATVTINLDDTVSISGSMTAGTGFTATTGDVAITAGNLDLPALGGGGTQGVINVSGTPALFFYQTGTYLGQGAGNFTTAGIDNTIIGESAAPSITGASNVVIGTEAGTDLLGGNHNTAIGTFALSGLTTGSANVAIGFNGGALYLGAESSNICIGTLGVTGDNNTIRIGDPAVQTSSFMAGQYGVVPSLSPQMATIGSDGQLGSQAIPGGGGTTWSEVTASTLSMAVGNGYILNNSGGVTATLPSTAAVGDIMEIVGKGTGGWTLAQNSGQTVHFLSQDTTTGTGGSISPLSLPADQYSALVIICTTANTDFVIKGSSGNFSVV